MELEQYLNRNYSQHTAKRYLFALNRYLSNPKTSTANYTQIMDYLGQLRKHQGSIRVELHAIKSYYRYLVETGQRDDNPAESIKLRDDKSRDIQLQDLFTSEELERLLEREERYPILKYRNNIIISLLIYQGLMTGEIKRLELTDIDLEAGVIKIKGSPKNNGRELKLRAKQVYWLINYIEKDRIQLLKEAIEKLIVSKLGKAESGEGISYLISSMQARFPNRKLTAKSIRQSVIANLLKAGKDLRLVQVYAGHKYPSSTEQYRQNDVEELKHEVLKYHPLDGFTLE